MKSFFHLDVSKAFGSDHIEFADDRATLRTVLQEVMRKGNGKIEVIDPATGKIDVDYFVLLNRRESQTLPQGLGTELHEGDEVAIGMMHYWGGG